MIAKGIQHILRESPENVNAGIVIASMQHNHVLYRRNATRFYIPASNLKLFTATAALLYLGADYRFKTEIEVAKKDIHHHTVEGNVYLKFNGDPTLTTSNLYRLIGELKDRGINKIDGNFYLDDTAFNNAKEYGHGWMWDELNTCYAAPLNAMTLNHNCVKTYLSPNRHIKRRAHLNIEYPARFLHFYNHVYTGNHSDKCTMNVKVTDNNEYTLSGCVQSDTMNKKFDFAVKNIGLYVRQNLQYLLKQNGIELEGNIKTAKMPNGLHRVAVHYSPRLQAIVTHTLKVSDDLYADSLLKTLGHVYYDRPGTWKNGVEAIKAILRRHAHIHFKNSAIVDGSGLSRYNMVSPNQVARLLTYDYHHFPVSAELLSALPISGIDGTLLHRMGSKGMRGKVRAKTGTMTSVSALSGYLSTLHHRHLMFVILMNNFTGKVDNYRILQDKICHFLVGNA